MEQQQKYAVVINGGNTIKSEHMIMSYVSAGVGTYHSAIRLDKQLPVNRYTIVQSG